MLEQPGAERITTAALAARLDVSEAALYRHFASKAQMFEGLMEFIETSVFGLLNQIAERSDTAALKARHMVTVLLQFAERNPGMARVMVGDALVFENDRLGQRMNQFFERFESSLRQVLRDQAQSQSSLTPTVEASLRQVLRDAAASRSSATPTVDAQVQASLWVSFVVGRLQRFARSGYKRSPLEHLDASLALLT
jgi:TetR/AcrR family transcriptional regulator